MIFSYLQYTASPWYLMHSEVRERSVACGVADIADITSQLNQFRSDHYKEWNSVLLGCNHILSDVRVL